MIGLIVIIFYARVNSTESSQSLIRVLDPITPEENSLDLSWQPNWEGKGKGRKIKRGVLLPGSFGWYLRVEYSPQNLTDNEELQK